MVDWQVTAKTIYCDSVDDEVTILVYKDWSANCTGFDKYHPESNPGKETIKLLKRKSQQLKRELGCQGLGCQRVVGYQSKLRGEEAKKGNPV